METPLLTVIDISGKTAEISDLYKNLPLTFINDHVIRVSVMTQPFYWHLHPNSDESFLVIEGSLLIDLENTTIELLPGQLFTVPKNTNHRTRPGGSKSVNLTFELKDIETIKTDDPEYITGS
ncbi:cupin domain-containing protein [Mucilaginibacter sp. OK098]|uniref:cupin domain-containing protein n=1 Tax=Mucilaginibacter sp. OK098 TaxID=1855297 RepID=UPI000918CC9B|nr:cupin domain-containing protein [Mucilaginibacter sp. OK098]SHN17354.1 Cupin domain-containing protein [Mucilaginibacter sp. OK098]